MAGIDSCSNTSSVLQKAIAVYLRWCRQKGIVENQPSTALSDIEDGEVVLRNANGELARYFLTAAGRLRRMPLNAGGKPTEGKLVVDLHGYPVRQAVEVAEKAIRDARQDGFCLIKLIHGAPDIRHWKTAEVLGRGGIKWALRGALSRGDWRENVYGRRSRQHSVEDGSMTLALRPPVHVTRHDANNR